MTEAESKDWFKMMSSFMPRIDLMLPRKADGKVETDFWENMYQAFKARMIEEINEEKSIEVSTSVLEQMFGPKK